MKKPAEDQVPALWKDLDALFPTATKPASWSGPRWWWAGPLDVEGLALASMQALATAVVEGASAAGRGIEASFSSLGVAAWFDSFTHLRISGAPIQGFAALSGFRQAADGWVRIHANYPHHEKALLSALGVAAAEVDDALLSLPAGAIEEAVTGRGGLAAVVRTPEEWAVSEAGRAVVNEPWIRLSLASARPPGRRRRAAILGGDGGALEGVRVLDLTRVIAGPSASRLLGGLGADVLRVDPPALPELEHQHVETGFAKRSAVADISNPGDLARLQALLPEADVVLTAYRGGALARHGLNAPALRETFPGLAVVSLDAWGDRGPWAGRRGFDSIVQAATGIAHVYGTGQTGSCTPGALPVQALDYATGLGMAAAAVALVSARSGGTSGSAHLSLARTATHLLGMPRPPAGLVRSELEPLLRRAPSDYGDLVFVPPPLIVDGQQVEYPSPPQRYGEAALSWL